MTLEQKLDLLRQHDVALKGAPVYGQHPYAPTNKHGEMDVVYAESLGSAADELIKFQLLE